MLHTIQKNIFHVIFHIPCLIILNQSRKALLIAKDFQPTTKEETEGFGKKQISYITRDELSCEQCIENNGYIGTCALLLASYSRGSSSQAGNPIIQRAKISVLFHTLSVINATKMQGTGRCAAIQNVPSSSLSKFHITLRKLDTVIQF